MVIPASVVVVVTVTVTAFGFTGMMVMPATALLEALTADEPWETPKLASDEGPLAMLDEGPPGSPIVPELDSEEVKVMVVVDHGR